VINTPSECDLSVQKYVAPISAAAALEPDTISETEVTKVLSLSLPLPLPSIWSLSSVFLFCYSIPL
jgi:hypothetical protein